MMVERLARSDIGQWLYLRTLLWPSETYEALAADVEGFFAPDGNEAAFVARDEDGTLVGLIEGALRPHAPGCATSPVGYIEGWYVRPACRRRGIGRALVARLEAWARDRGCREMASDTDSDYPVSPLAHERLGYREVARYAQGACRLEPGHDKMACCMHFCKRLAP